MFVLVHKLTTPPMVNWQRRVSVPFNPQSSEADFTGIFPVSNQTVTRTLRSRSGYYSGVKT